MSYEEYVEFVKHLMYQRMTDGAYWKYYYNLGEQ
jgi:hypothetical protein